MLKLCPDFDIPNPDQPTVRWINDRCEYHLPSGAILLQDVKTLFYPPPSSVKYEIIEYDDD